ncbi:hypothetical protein MMPV_001406 [Pyropia vietnamensis]
MAGGRLPWRHRRGGTDIGGHGGGDVSVGGRRWPRPASVGMASAARRAVLVAAASSSSSSVSGGAGGGGASPDEDGVAVRRARGAADVAAAIGVWSAVAGRAVEWEEDVDGAASTTHVIAWAPDGTVRYGGWGKRAGLRDPAGRLPQEGLCAALGSGAAANAVLVGEG